MIAYETETKIDYKKAFELLVKVLGIHRFFNIYGATNNFMFYVNDECTSYSLTEQAKEELTKKEFEELQQILDNYISKDEEE